MIVKLVHKQQSKHVKVINKKKKNYKISTTRDAFNFNEPIRMDTPVSTTEFNREETAMV